MVVPSALSALAVADMAAHRMTAIEQPDQARRELRDHEADEDVVGVLGLGARAALADERDRLARAAPSVRAASVRSVGSAAATPRRHRPRGAPRRAPPPCAARVGERLASSAPRGRAARRRARRLGARQLGWLKNIGGAWNW